MAAKVFPGNYTAELGPNGAVVFLIGMRLNRLWRIDKWWPVFIAMPRMLRLLSSDPESGLLGYHTWFGGRNLLVQQYWRSVEELIAFASDSTAPHADVWRDFNRKIGSSELVGIWHETYQVGPGRAEVIYGNMPAFGLAAATRHVQIGPGTRSARARLSRRAADGAA